MSLADGSFKEELYMTTDTAFAAYLMLRGYDLLGKTESGYSKEDGSPIYHLCLLGSGDPKDVTKKFDEFENLWLQVPHDDDNRINMKKYYSNTRTCIRAFKGEAIIV